MKRGIVLSVFSSVLFAVLYYYATVLYPLDGGAIFAWRVLLALPALALFISRARGWKEIFHISRRLGGEWRLLFFMVLAAALLGIQLWLFVWAPLHQRAIDVSLGYFLLPLVMVVVGRLFYRERLTAVQRLAVMVAAVGVAHEVVIVGSFSWVTALVIFGYPPYFMLRRRLRFGSLAGLWFDMLFLTPAALWVLQAGGVGVIQQFIEFPRLIGLIPVLGLISSTALVSYISASRMLPLGLFGILGYVEPILLFWVAALLLHEEIAPEAWWTYVPIWIAVALIMSEGLFRWFKESTADSRTARR